MLRRWPRRTRPQTPREYGHAAGYNDRHVMRDPYAEKACQEAHNGYQKWLAGWRAGQAARRAEKPEKGMLYKPLYPFKPPAGKGKVQTECPKPEKGKRKAVPAANSSRQPVERT